MRISIKSIQMVLFVNLFFNFFSSLLAQTTQSLVLMEPVTSGEKWNDLRHNQEMLRAIERAVAKTERLVKQFQKTKGPFQKKGSLDRQQKKLKMLQRKRLLFEREIASLKADIN